MTMRSYIDENKPNTLTFVEEAYLEVRKYAMKLATDAGYESPNAVAFAEGYMSGITRPEKMIVNPDFTVDWLTGYNVGKRHGEKAFKFIQEETS